MKILSLFESQKIFIDAHRAGNMLWIDMMHVPKALRGQGEGRRYYEEWEVRLPKEIEYIRLEPVDAGDGPADGFWEAMGFDYLYWGDDEDDGNPRDMVKGVNGHQAPRIQGTGLD